MKSLISLFLVCTASMLSGCADTADSQPDSQVAASDTSNTVPDFWHDATVYFIMLDRFANGDPLNDKAYGRTKESSYLRGLHGGDLRGVIDKLDAGYFDDLSVDAIWFTPVVEQIHGQDHGWGSTYAYHGYWPKDCATVDTACGSESDLKELVEKARARGIKILLDVIINHTGPVTDQDAKWPDDWVRMTPECQWNSFAANVSCGLNNNLPDIKTEINSDVALPDFLLKKWQNEGRLETELAELDAFFSRTGLPRAPKNYIVKWLTDWVKEYGVDGFRVDTAKHVEPEIWEVLRAEAQYSLELWRKNNPQQVSHDLPFFMVGEVMHFGVDGHRDTVPGTRLYDYGDKQVDFFSNGMHSLINMGFVKHAELDYESLFSLYSRELNEGALKGVGILNYVASHDDPEPYDIDRADAFNTANKLMLSPGAVQIYYGDEVSRPINDPDPSDAKLRLPFDWATLEQAETQKILAHWQKLTGFRKAHQAVGSGVHQRILSSPYVFSRQFKDQDKVIVGLDMQTGVKVVPVNNLWDEGTPLYDYYSGQEVVVENNQVTVNSEFTLVLLGQKQE